MPDGKTFCSRTMAGPVPYALMKYIEFDASTRPDLGGSPAVARKVFHAIPAMWRVTLEEEIIAAISPFCLATLSQ